MRASLNRRALLIGTAHYQDSRFTPLLCTQADTAGLNAALRHPDIGVFATVTVYENLTSMEFRSAITEFFRSVTPNDLALVYVTGHGKRLREADGEFFFVTTDTDYDDIADTGVSAGFVNHELQDCYAGARVVLLDCCESGGFVHGLQTSTVAKSARPATSPPPEKPKALLTPTGVYVFSSSAPDEESFGSSSNPDRPSAFTGTVIESLRTGAAGTSESGEVTVAELCRVVQQRLAGGRQTPLTSSFQVSDEIPIANRPRRPVPLALSRTALPAPPSVRRPHTLPDWKALLSYYRRVAEIEATSSEFISTRSNNFIYLPSPERLIAGSVDTSDDGSVEIALPPHALDLIQRTNDENVELWAGWPLVTVTDKRGEFAPLLVRPVNLEYRPDNLVRLEPDGEVQLHPGLVNRLLQERGEEFRARYQPHWFPGEADRLASHVAGLLEQLDVQPRERLHPSVLSEGLPPGAPASGAYNAAILYLTKRKGANFRLVEDFKELIGNPTKLREVPRTALAPLLEPTRPDMQRVQDEDVPSPVTPLPANESQLGAIRAAMRERLTVVTGPPGTGKSQLIVNVVATALAADQSVLVASNNNEAVDEVVRRCDELVPGLVVRTGKRDTIEKEVAGLRVLLTAPAPEPGAATQTVHHRLATEDLDEQHIKFGRHSQWEWRLAETANRLRAGAAALGVDVSWRTAVSAERARAVADTWLFGEWRRRRLLLRASLEDRPADRPGACKALAEFAAAAHSWDTLSATAVRAPTDNVLLTEMRSARHRVSMESSALARATVHDRARRGRSVLEALVESIAPNTDRTKFNSWSLMRSGALSSAGGWAVTCLSARRRFPLQPGLFDLVIIDEASQCSIPAVIPTLYRAKRALIVGDPMQLSDIPGVTSRQDRQLRESHQIDSAWADARRLSVSRYSAYHAFAHAAGSRRLLDEHFRCQPQIAEFASDLFYGGALTVLTNTTGRPALDAPPIQWSEVAGSARRGQDGRSWLNEEEVDHILSLLRTLLAERPTGLDIGVVTPYRAQRDALRSALHRLGTVPDELVRVGTAHAFQGGERDVMIFSLVAAANHHPSRFNWFDGQRQLWNVAITRARSNLIIVGDREVWRTRGGVGAALLTASESPDEPLRTRNSDSHQRFYRYLRDQRQEFEVARRINGHVVDAVLRDGTVLLFDPGTNGDKAAAARHLEQMLLQRDLVSTPDRQAARVAAWHLDLDMCRPPA